ncbi:MAG: hypothetical protein WAQ22_00375 [Candidatus Saccharimonas sp.]
MKQQKQTIEQLHQDDVDMLRVVLESVRGITPVSVYDQATWLGDDASEAQ